MHYHLIGIAGTAMASLAGLLREKGHTVTGSDEGVYPPMSDMLDDLGIAYARSFDPANLGDPAPDVVVVGNAISRGNEELEAVLDGGLRYTSAAATLKEEFLRGRHVLAVAGTHGKTTTTSILAWLLESAGLRPSFLVGGVAENFGTSFRLTDSELFVVEADEYDTAYFDKGPKMWHYLPRTAVVTNVEFDHADIYRDEVAYRFAFERFVNLVPRTGTLVLGWEGEVERDLAERSFAPVESFAVAAAAPSATGEGASHSKAADSGTAERGPSPSAATRSDASEDGSPDSADEARESSSPVGSPSPPEAPRHPRWRAIDLEHGPTGTAFTVVRDGREIGRFTTPVAGAFNIRNCLAAIAAARAAGAGWDGVREGLATFRSVRRRMEVRGEVRGVTVIDDFAHHPTAVRETLDAARQRFGLRGPAAAPERGQPSRPVPWLAESGTRSGRLVAVFEPRSYTAQRREFQDAFRRALGAADRVVLAGLFHPERYDESTGMDPRELVEGLRSDGVPADYVPEVDEIVRRLAEEARPGDVILLMSNGGFGGIHEKLMGALRR